METLSRSKGSSWLPWFLRGVLFLAFLILFARLADLQLIRGAYYRGLSEGNRIRRVRIKAPRGDILAKNGEVLAGSIEVKKRVIFDPEEGYSISSDIKNARDDELVTDPMRDYKLGEVAAHITGYLGEADEEEVGRVTGECPEKGPKALGGLVGRSGLEQYYNCLLTGIDGEEMVEVDAQGKKIRTLGVRDPIPGEDLHTHIDYGMQREVAKLMEDKPGAVVITDKNGKVLSLFSSPSYDPNEFIQHARDEVLDDIFENESLPLFNRAIGGKFPPGSVFKPLIGLAALEEDKIDSGYRYTDIGYIAIDDYQYRNWYYTQHGGTEGELGLVRAIARSTDTFFYKLGEILGMGNIEKWGQKFGLDERTGIDLTGEIDGLMPGREWKLDTKGEKWYLGNTYHLSIGQGDLAVTPVALHKAILSIANGGKFCTPTIAGETNCENLDVSQENLSIIKMGMREACAPGGTAFTFFDFPKKEDETVVACKTGTAEIGESDETHAWFVAFAPIDDPEIVATVLIEEGGEGSYDAGPVARSIFNYWFGITEKPTPTVSPALTP